MKTSTTEDSEGTEREPKFFRQLFWRPVADELPDDEETVLLHLEGGEVWTGFLDGRVWRFVSADKIEEEVLHWAPFPHPPGI